MDVVCSLLRVYGGDVPRLPGARFVGDNRGAHETWNVGRGNKADGLRFCCVRFSVVNTVCCRTLLATKTLGLDIRACFDLRWIDEPVLPSGSHSLIALLAETRNEGIFRQELVTGLPEERNLGLSK